MRLLTATTLALSLIGCSTAEMPGDIFDMGPDASPPEEEVLEDEAVISEAAEPEVIGKGKGEDGEEGEESE